MEINITNATELLSKQASLVCAFTTAEQKRGEVKQELQVQIYELRDQIHELRVQIYELRVQIHELQVQIHESGH